MMGKRALRTPDPSRIRDYLLRDKANHAGDREAVSRLAVAIADLPAAALGPGTGGNLMCRPVGRTGSWSSAPGRKP